MTRGLPIITTRVQSIILSLLPVWAPVPAQAELVEGPANHERVSKTN